MQAMEGELVASVVGADVQPGAVGQPLPEQPDDWTAQGAYLVAPGVHRIPLPMPSDGLRGVNIYVIEGDAGLVVVDSGWAIPVTATALETALGLLGHRIADLNRFVITHAHHDHYTQALALRERFGCHVSLGRGERHSVERYGTDASEPHLASLRRAGALDMVPEYRALKLQELEDDTCRWEYPDRWLDDGEVIDVGGRLLEVLATPGHTRGHVVFRDETAGLLFSGDHILPHITPSIGYEADPEPFPLKSYLESLQLVRGLPDALLLPAHGLPTISVHERVGELLMHHEDRFTAIIDRVREGRHTAYEVAAELPWTRRGRRLTELDLTNRALAVMETLAHLDVLDERGLVATERDPETSTVAFTVAAA